MNHGESPIYFWKVVEIDFISQIGALLSPLSPSIKHRFGIYFLYLCSLLFPSHPVVSAKFCIGQMEIASLWNFLATNICCHRHGIIITSERTSLPTKPPADGQVLEVQEVYGLRFIRLRNPWGKDARFSMLGRRLTEWMWRTGKNITISLKPSPRSLFGCVFGAKNQDLS